MDQPRDSRKPGSTPVVPEYLTTPEAAKYLRKSVSWLLRQDDIPYLPGNPNVYAKRDLDRWFEGHKVELDA